MRKSIVILITLIVVFTGSLVFAEQSEIDYSGLPGKRLTEKERAKSEAQKAKADEDREGWERIDLFEDEAQKAKKAKELEKKVKAWEAKRQPRLSKFKKTLKDVGRFQVIKAERATMFILDTKEGHFWVWGVMKGVGALTYGGQLCPGEYMGEKIIYWIK